MRISNAYAIRRNHRKKIGGQYKSLQISHLQIRHDPVESRRGTYCVTGVTLAHVDCAVSGAQRGIEFHLRRI
jgi:hypothetical protein